MPRTQTLLRSLLGTLPDTLRFGHVPTGRDYPSPIADGAAGNAVIASTLRAGAPCLITRLGLSELMCISHYRRWRRPALLHATYPPYVRDLIHVNAGVFPDDDATLDRFSARFLEAAGAADVMAVWLNRGEPAVIAERCPGAALVSLPSLDCMCHPEPWSAELAGKRVLVVHPFARTIESQYRDHRRQLFADPLVLPEFELSTLQPPQSIAGQPCGHVDWFSALDETCMRIAERDFDVAIIGAGAYGLPIGAFVKGLGRQAVHMGGVTQLLFGILGRRWETEYSDVISPLVNEHWAKPSAEERPDGAESVEAGCYW